MKAQEPKNLHEASPVNAKYVFLDVVSFTRNRSVEAQTDIVRYLNKIVRDAVKKHSLESKDIIYLPTGDGLCIVLKGDNFKYDDHLNLGLSILDGVAAHNANMDDKMRSFEIRVGINENTDNEVTDINDSPNIAGAGINIAQRVMDFCDGGNLFAGPAVHEKLRHREKYMSSFQGRTKVIKHGTSLLAFQFIEPDHTGVNIEAPEAFRVKKAKIQPLPRIVAYYIAYAILHKEEIAQDKDLYRLSEAVILLWLLSRDAVAREEAPPAIPNTLQQAPRGKSWEERILQMRAPCLWVSHELAHHIMETFLSPFINCFEHASYQTAYTYVREDGVRRLEQEHADIWEQLQSRRLVD